MATLGFCIGAPRPIEENVGWIHAFAGAGAAVLGVLGLSRVAPSGLLLFMDHYIVVFGGPVLAAFGWTLLGRLRPPRLTSSCAGWAPTKFASTAIRGAICSRVVRCLLTYQNVGAAGCSEAEPPPVSRSPCDPGRVGPQRLLDGDARVFDDQRVAVSRAEIFVQGELALDEDEVSDVGRSHGGHREVVAPLGARSVLQM